MTEQKQTLAQRRAAHALQCINDIKDKEHGNYKSYVSGLPANILMSGLGQAAATLCAGKKEGHRLLYAHLSDWLCGADEDSPYPKGDNLLENITKHDEDAYLHAQNEAMAYLEWLKKFATAFLKGDVVGE
jgi:CRISPR-associated protein Cmr5